MTETQKKEDVQCPHCGGFYKSSEVTWKIRAFSLGLLRINICKKCFFMGKRLIDIGL